MSSKNSSLEFDPFYLDVAPEVLREMDESNKKYKALREKQQKINLKLRKLKIQKAKIFNDFMKESEAFEKRKNELKGMMNLSLKLDHDTIGINKRADVVLMKSVPKGRAYLGAFQTYSITPVPKHQFSYDRFFRDSKPEVRKLLQQKLAQLKGLKFSLSYLGYFVIAGTGL